MPPPPIQSDSEEVGHRATNSTLFLDDKDQARRTRTLRIRKLNYHFGSGELRKQVLFNNHLDVYQGEIVIMTGPSGSGKTTLLTLIGTLRTVQEGSLRVLGRELAGASPTELVAIRRELGFIFQHHNLFESLTAQENVRMALELFPLGGSERNKRSAEMLSRLGLGHRATYKPGSLSGGQKQRVAIARGLVHKPKIILADEPTAALDEKSGRELVTLFQQLAREDGCTILMVTHDNRILDVADRIVNMVDGRIKSDVLVQEASVICDFLRKIPQFAGLSLPSLSEIADRMLVENYPPGVDVVRQGEAADKFYLIRHGVVEVLRTESVDGKETTRQLAELTEGNFFGEAALLTGAPRNATVRTRGRSILYTLAKADFDAAVQASATFHEELQKALFARQ